MKADPEKKRSREFPSRAFGHLLRYYRAQRELTQRQLQEQLIEHGFYLGDSTISMWERGKRLPEDSRSLHFLGKGLGLEENEEVALVSAWLISKSIMELEDYLAIKEEATSRPELSRLLEHLKPVWFIDGDHEEQHAEA